MSLAEELVKAGQVDDVKRYLKAALEQDPYLRLVACDHTSFWRQLGSALTRVE